MGFLLPFMVIAVLILLNGLFVAAEFSIIGVRKSRMEHLAEEGNRTADWVRRVLDDSRKTDRWIATAQLGITLASLGLGMYAEPAIAHLIEEPLHDWFGLSDAAVHTVSFVIALSIITYLHVVMGEMVPKSLALQKPEADGLVAHPPHAIFRPHLLDPGDRVEPDRAAGAESVAHTAARREQPALHRR